MGYVDRVGRSPAQVTEELGADVKDLRTERGLAAVGEAGDLRDERGVLRRQDVPPRLEEGHRASVAHEERHLPFADDELRPPADAALFRAGELHREHVARGIHEPENVGQIRHQTTPFRISSRVRSALSTARSGSSTALPPSIASSEVARTTCESSSTASRRRPSWSVRRSSSLASTSRASKRPAYPAVAWRMASAARLN